MNKKKNKKSSNNCANKYCDWFDNLGLWKKFDWNFVLELS